jgi:hypothetical protein
VVRSASSGARRSGRTGPLWAGTEKFGVRWKIVNCSACSAISGIDWMPEEPVPITPTRLPVKSTPSWGHRLVKYTSPANRSAPSMSGLFGSDRHPVAIT